MKETREICWPCADILCGRPPNPYVTFELNIGTSVTFTIGNVYTLHQWWVFYTIFFWVRNPCGSDRHTGGWTDRQGSYCGLLWRQHNESRKNQLCVMHCPTVVVCACCCQEADKLSDDDLYKFLVELKKPSYALKKLKCLPGVWALSLFSMSPFPRCIIIMCLSKHKYLFYATRWVSFYIA